VVSEIWERTDKQPHSLITVTVQNEALVYCRDAAVAAADAH